MLARAFAGHLSIREAADLCDIGRGAWTNWEKGARPVDMLDVAEVVSEKLNVSREWLLFGGPLSAPEHRRQLRRTRKGTLTAPYRSRSKFRPAGARSTHHPEGVRRPVLLRDPLGVR
jgi:hypothetical protein